MIRRNATLRSTWRAAALVSVLGGFGAQLAAAELNLRWSELSAAVSGKTLTLVARDGARLEGKVLEVGSEALIIHVKRSSNALDYPEAKLVVSRESVAFFELKKPASKVLRGVLIGIGTGAAGAALVAGLLGAQASAHAPRTPSPNQIRNAGIAIGAVSVFAGVMVGIQEGRQHIDQVLTIIRIAPEAQPAQP
jgi:hypothetical protein